jgi:hypothetical protein
MFIKPCQDFTVVFNFHQLRQLHESLEQTGLSCKLSSSSKFFACTIGGHKKLGQTSNLYKVKNHKYTSCKFDFLEIRL